MGCYINQTNYDVRGCIFNYLPNLARCQFCLVSTTHHHDAGLQLHEMVNARPSGTDLARVATFQCRLTLVVCGELWWRGAGDLCGKLYSMGTMSPFLVDAPASYAAGEQQPKDSVTKRAAAAQRCRRPSSHELHNNRLAQFDFKERSTVAPNCFTMGVSLCVFRGLFSSFTAITAYLCGGAIERSVGQSNWMERVEWREWITGSEVDNEQAGVPLAYDTAHRHGKSAQFEAMCIQEILWVAPEAYSTTNDPSIPAKFFADLPELTHVGLVPVVSCDYTGNSATTDMACSSISIDSFFLMQTPSLETVDLSGLANRVPALPNHFLSSSGIIEIDLSVFGSAVQSVGDNVLSHCRRLRCVGLDGLSHVATVGQNFLCGCVELTAIDLSPLTGLESVGASCLSHCIKMETATLGAVVGACVITPQCRQPLCPANADESPGEIHDVAQGTPSNTRVVDNYFMTGCTALRVLRVCCAGQVDHATWSSNEPLPCGYFSDVDRTRVEFSTAV